MHALHVIYNGFVLCFPETMLWLAQSIRSCRLSQLIHVAFTESCESDSAPEASRGRPCSLHRLQSVILMTWSSFSSLTRHCWQYNCNRWQKFWQQCVRVNSSRDFVKVSLPMVQCICQSLCVFEKSCQIPAAPFRHIRSKVEFAWRALLAKVAHKSRFRRHAWNPNF